MARILANRLVLHGNKSIKKLEKEIFVRFNKDSKKFGQNRNSQGIKKILFGLNDGDEFDWEKEVGAPWGYFQLRDGKDPIVFISPYSAVAPLQDYITLHAAKLDPKVIVQLEYEDISGAVIGTRLTTFSSGIGVSEYKVHNFTPSADNRELTRVAMNKIRSSQRSAVQKEIVKQLGAEYKQMDLNTFPCP
jgi:hypothetical protein